VSVHTLTAKDFPCCVDLQLQCLEARPDQTAMELLTEFQARYPGFYKSSHLG